MDIEEIDSWYEEEKEKIFNEYLDKNEANPKEAEEKFKGQMKKARDKYEELYEKSGKSNVIKKHIAKVKDLSQKFFKK